MNKKIKQVGILNYWWTNNYGALLTAFALYILVSKYLSKENICLISDWKKCFYKDIFTSLFLKKYNILTSCYSRDKQKAYFDNFEVLISGSDQVFRGDKGSFKYIWEHLTKYFLIVPNINIKKIAFSASFGINRENFLKETSQRKIEHMKISLKSFDFISVREKSGVEICRDLFDVKAEWIIDPVFIIARNKWDILINDATKDYSNKIISYVLDTNKEYKKASKYLSKQHNTEVIELANSNESVENWLKAIRDCKFLITDSFHGMCFAIIFNKPFICLANKKRGATRFESILEMLNIDYQCINNIKEIYERNCIFEVDYDVVNKRIEEERQRGLDFLKTALEAPVQVTPEKVEARMKFLENKVCELEHQATLKYQIKNYLWEMWLIIFHKYLPEPVKNIIRLVRDRLCK